MPANSPHYQAIRRALVVPMFGVTSDEQLANVQKSYSQLAQEVVNCHNRVLVDQITVGGGVATLTVTLPAPFPDTSYSPLVIPDWAAFPHITAITTTTFTVGFSAASPGGGGVVRLIVIR